MNFQSVNNLRNRRYDHNIFGPTHYSIANYCTDNRREMAPVCMEEIFTASQHKNEMKNAFGDDFFINNLHLIPDPLKKNLADTLITEDKMGKGMKEEVKEDPHHPPPDAQTAMAGITSFFSGVFNILSSAVFKRPKSPVNYYDCVDHETREMAPKCWPAAKTEDRDKNGHTNDQSSSNNSYKTNLKSQIPEISVKSEPANMSDCRAAVAHCEDKLNRVRALLSSKTAPIPTRSRLRRPKKVFVEPGSVEDSFEDAFSPEDFVSLSNGSYVEYFSPAQYCDSELYQTESSLVRTRVCPQESTVNDFEKRDSPNKNLLEDLKTDNVSEINVPETTMDPSTNVCKQEIVLSCEDKLSKLKALLLEKRKKNTISMETSLPEPLKEEPQQSRNVPVNKTKDKRFKNPNRSTSKRKKSQLRRTIDDDMTFANEILLDEQSSIENSPTITFVQPEMLPNSNKCNFFDEVCGRFRSDSITDSEDSFQIVVADCPRLRRPSDCDSEDSFIVFEDSPDSCYTSNEVFFESDSESASDSESDMSDSGCMTTLSHILTRTVSNLADDNLYNEDKQCDEVDCVFNGLQSESAQNEDAKKGLLMNEERKSMRKKLPEKKVTFSSQPPKVHVMRVWAFAAQQARVGPWEGYARDRDRFQRRIANVDMAVAWVLKPQHRSRVVFQRFMPWWNAEARREAAEKKLKEVAEKERSDGEQSGEVVEKLRSDEEKSEEVVKKLRSEVDSEPIEVKCVLNQAVKYNTTKNNNTEVVEKEDRLVNGNCFNENELKNDVEIIPSDDKFNDFVNSHVKEILNT